MYSVFAELLEKNNKKANDVAKATGISPTTFSDWKRGKSSPKQDKLQKIADYFGVSLNYLMTGKNETEEYYFDDETAKMAQYIFERPGLRGLFDAAKDVSPEELKLVSDMVLAFKKKSQPDNDEGC